MNWNSRISLCGTVPVRISERHLAGQGHLDEQKSLSYSFRILILKNYRHSNACTIQTVSPDYEDHSDEVHLMFIEQGMLCYSIDL